MFTSPPPPTGGSFHDFSGQPIPAGFFGPGSDPFTGVVQLEGVPLSGVNVLGADTIVERQADAVLPTCPSEDTIPVEIVALSLASTSAITVTFNGGTSSGDYDLDVHLSSQVAQPPGTMTIRHECPDGGSFDSHLPVVPRLVFTRLTGPGIPQAVIDPAPQLDFNASGHWSHVDPGFVIIPSPGGTVDHDGNPGTPDVPFAPTSNFIVGIQWTTCGCGGNSAPAKRLTVEQALLAAHGILPNSDQPVPSDSSTWGRIKNHYR